MREPIAPSPVVGGYASASPPQSPFVRSASSFVGSPSSSVATPSPSPFPSPYRYHQSSSHQSSAHQSSLVMEQAAFNRLLSTARASKRFRIKTPITGKKDLYTSFMSEMTRWTSFTTEFTRSRMIDLTGKQDIHMKAICAA